MRNLFWGITFVFIGLLLLLDNLGYASFEDVIHDYWPLILIVWGGLILFRKRSPEPAPVTSAETAGMPSPPPPSIGAQGSSTTMIGDLVHESQVFGNVYTRVTSQNFKGGSLSSIFGDCILDLSNAVIAEGEHELRIHSVFGSAVITLQPETAVSVSASSLFGSISILGQHKGGISSDLQTATPSFATKTNRLKISLSNIFGAARVN